MIDFRRFRWLINKLQRIQWDVERKEAAATRITTNITGMPRGGGGNRQEEAYVILADVLDAYRESLAELDAMRAELKPFVDALTDPDERAVMRMRYMDGYAPSAIAAGIHLDERSVYRYLTRAERKVVSQCQ